MLDSYKKRLIRAANALRELAEDLEGNHPKDYDAYGERIEELAAEIEDLYGEIEDNETLDDDYDDE